MIESAAAARERPGGVAPGGVTGLALRRGAWLERPYFERPWLGLLLSELSLWRYAVLGARTPVLVHDNLDSVVVWQRLVVDSGTLFASDDALVPPIMGGMPRSSFDSELNGFSLLNAALSPFAAYVANAVILVAVAFFGMWLLVRDHLVTEAPIARRALIATGVAVGFATLPHWAAGGLSVAAMPLLLHAFLALRRGGHSAWSWAPFVLFPFYSSLVLSFAIYLVFGMVMLADLVRGRWHWRLVVAIGVLTGAFVVAEHRLFVGLVGTQAPAHRVEFQTQHESLLHGGLDALSIFLRGHYHAPSLHTFVVLPAVALALLLGRRSGRAWALLAVLLAGLVATSLVYGGLELAAIEPLRQRVGLLRTFNFGRVHWLHPLLWSMAFAVAVGLLERRVREHPRLARWSGWMLLPLALQMGDVQWQGRKASNVGGRLVPFDAFYAPELFRQVADYIGLPQSDYRVVSVGMHPAVAQYNGFYTLDGYLANYPLSYKHEFRRVIAPELARNDAARAYFDGWGSRAYVFSADLFRGCRALCTKELKAEVHELKLDTHALFEQGGRYVLSAVPIRKADGLELLRRFDSDAAAWSVFLYGVVPPLAAKYFRDDQPR
ncbi:MAG TPA: DUF6044 family protein [Polyangiaceae bacterium]|nr:DUF6044 family protein [Polyangiaceae bacterium]